MKILEKFIALCWCDGSILNIPHRSEIELSPKEYAEFKKLMTQNLGKWKGGNSQYFVFPFMAQKLLDRLKAGERPNYKQDWHYFPTPDKVIEKMANTEVPLYNGKFLEPSAGRGAIRKYMHDFGGRFHDQQWDLIEIEDTNRVHLLEETCVKYPNTRLIWDDLETFPIPPIKDRYDAIYANPPFKRAIEHVRILGKLLNEWGTLICVLPSNFESKYSKEMEELEAKYGHLYFYPIEEGSFKVSGTGVSTVLMQLENVLEYDFENPYVELGQQTMEFQ